MVCVCVCGCAGSAALECSAFRFDPLLEGSEPPTDSNEVMIMDNSVCIFKCCRFQGTRTLLRAWVTSSPLYTKMVV